MRVAILPARGGSVRIPGKNIKPFMGKPMILWAIEAAVYSDLFDEIIVSTDSVAISNIAVGHGCEIHLRNQDDGTTGTQEIAARVLDGRPEFDEACVIYPCSPMLTADDLKVAHVHWIEHTLAYMGPCYCYSVLPGGADAGCFYFGPAHHFRDRRPLDALALQCRVPANRFIDINTPEDWARAESMFKALHP